MGGEGGRLMWQKHNKIKIMKSFTILFSLFLVIAQLNVNAVPLENEIEYDNLNPEPESILDDLIVLDYVDKDDIKEEDINGVHDIMSMIYNDELSSDESDESSDYESVEDDGEDIVLIVDIAPVDFEEYDYNLPTSDVQFVKNNEYFDYSDLVDTNADSQGSWVPEAANYDYPSEDVNLETVIDEDGETLLDYPHLEEGASMSEKTRSLKRTINEIYKQQKILHIILLLGICLIVLVMFFAVVSLFVSVLTRRPDVNNNNLQQVEGVRQIKLKNSGIVKSYAKVPVEIKNMFPSNVAYKQLYEV